MSELQDTNRWYAVQVRPKCEKTVADRLKAHSEAYLPMQMVRRRWSDRWKKLLVPLIPGYLFAHIDASEKIAVLRTPNVLAILSRNGRICPIPDRELDLLRKVEASRVPFEFSTERFKLKEGDHVLFNSGPLLGEEGYVVRFINRSKVYLRVPTLQGYLIAEAAELAPRL